MRILLVASPAFYNNSNGIGSPYHGGGWMYTIQKELISSPDVELGICFRNTTKTVNDMQNGVHYYGYSEHKKRMKDKILDLLHYNDASRDKAQWAHYLNQARKFIEDFKPDIIHIFGSETYNQLIALVGKEKGIPTVLHIQGLLTLYDNCIIPPAVSRWQYYWKDGIFKSYRNFQELTNWKRSIYREKTILASVPYVMGRTIWDKQAASFLAPQAKYLYCGEILRPEFYTSASRMLPKQTTIISISSSPLYKGFDIILKTAYILKHVLKIDFEWKVYGNVTSCFWEKHLGINHTDVNIRLCGVATACQLREALLNSTIYFQSSYIENSPNSVAEAQLLGIPVVATNVGGTCSLIKDGETGYLFPATDPYIGAYYVKYLATNLDTNLQVGKAGQHASHTRHDVQSVMQDIYSAYNDIIYNQKGTSFI